LIEIDLQLLRSLEAKEIPTKIFHLRFLAVAMLLLSNLGLLECGGGGNSSTHSCPTLSGPESSSGSIESVVDPIIANEIKAQALVGMAVGIAKNGNILYSQGYGYGDLSTCQPIQRASEFQIGSVTKQFTAAAILQLQNAGRLNIDDALVVYLPGFDSRITLRMLLNQTSGLADYLGFPEAKSWAHGVAEQAVLTQIEQAPLAFTPGSLYSYSNSNYFILGSIIEKVTGLTYANYLAANIFTPVGLSHTSYLQPPDSASPYKAGSLPGLLPDPSLYFSAGALWSNVQDLAAWDAALLNGKVIPSSLFTVMVTPPSVPSAQGGPSDYAMGWVRSSAVGHPFVWHNGETYSYTAFNGVFLDDGFSVIMLTNMPVKEFTPLLNLGNQLINAICTSSGTAGNC
jgi:CubicO group peptidase (beta-lactamase class C family)